MSIGCSREKCGIPAPDAQQRALQEPKPGNRSESYPETAKELNSYGSETDGQLPFEGEITEVTVQISNLHQAGWLTGDKQIAIKVLNLVLSCPKQKVNEDQPEKLGVPQWTLRYARKNSGWIYMDVDRGEERAWIWGGVVADETRDTSKERKRLAELLNELRESVRRQ